jgi:two-component system, NarL family, nitrate/nitrite response regulator NarL
MIPDQLRDQLRDPIRDQAHDLSVQGSFSAAELALVEVSETIAVLTRRRFLADLILRTVGPTPITEFRSTRVVVVDAMLATTDPAVIDIVTRARSGGEMVVAVSTPSTPLAAACWVEIGANAVLTDDATVGDLLDVIERLQRNETVLGVSVREGLLSQLRSSRQERADRDALFVSLTKREREVLQKLALGASPEDVAKTSFVSLNTVRSQIRGILAKLDVSSVVAAVSLAYRSGWLQEDPSF